MNGTVKVKKAIVIADTSLEQQMLAECLKLGAHGYTCAYCFGKGDHQIIEDPFTGHSRVRIEILVQPDIAAAIMDYIHRPEFENRAVIGYLEDVEVRATDKFF